MSINIKCSLIATLLCGTAFAQNIFEGQIVDKNQRPIPFITLTFDEKDIHTDAEGKFKIENLSKGKHHVEINEQGYEPFSQTVTFDTQQKIVFTLTFHNAYKLDEVTVLGHHHDFTTANTERVDQTFIQENYAGSLAKSLENIAGVNASGIGASASKPIIRGLGFNRLIVTENGVKQEGQQWGADHGLEIDALNVEDIEVIKGPSALEYGNEAIAGVIKINNNNLPKKNSTSGEVRALYQSINDNYALGFNLKSRGDKFFYKIKGSYSDYADYRTTADRIYYLSRYLPIYNKRVKNTAGQDINSEVQAGFVGDKFRSILTLSNVNQKIGFFPGSHGIPLVDRLQDDGNYRNVEFPYQSVNHFKAISENEFRVDTKNTIKFITSYQNNHRQEISAFHTHYGNQQAPTKNPDLELDFKLTTYDSQLKFEHNHNKNFKTIIGAQAQLQSNNVAGYNYLLPEYDRNIFSGFLIEEFKKGNTWKVNAGIRYDYATFKSQGYFDQILYDYLITQNNSPSLADYYANRSKTINKNYSNLNAMVGATYQPNDLWDFNLNFGTNFRLPTAIELGANGIHHGSFRHERGNENLDTEKGLALDFKASFHKNDWLISASPYLYYFSNYIFLKPSGQFSILPHGGQIYEYTQSKALLTGFEIEVRKKINENFDANVIYEYLYNRQIQDNNKFGYYLPFTPANNLFGQVNYNIKKSAGIFENFNFFVNGKYTFEQDKIALNEDITPSYFLVGLGGKTTVKINNFTANLSVQVSNLFNENYFNHTSFYRALQLPEQARNIQVMLGIPFGKK
jgi:iron complex outermembrane receptor protein